MGEPYSLCLQRCSVAVVGMIDEDIPEVLREIKIAAELLRPVQQMIDYEGMYQRLIKTYNIRHWVSGRLTGTEVWRSWS